MINSLNKKWKEPLFAFSGFGPNFLMVLMGAYFTDAINPVALGENNSFQAIASGVCFILPVLFSIFYTISKVFDGIIDVPFAYITDNLQTKWGRRRPTIAICFIPMVISYALCWIPLSKDNQLLNTIWIFINCMIFFSTYTMCLISFYGSLSTTCINEQQRLRVSSFKSFFDTITYCFVYALVPLILNGLQVHIDKFVFMSIPLMFTMIIPLFLIKEGEKYGYPENKGLKSEKLKFSESLRLTFKNKIFKWWLVVNCCTFFGLQMFLVGMNAMIIGGMGFNGSQMALVNTCAFAPVPIMLYLFNKLKNKKGVRFTYQTCLLSFSAAIMSFFFGSLYICGNNPTLQLIIAAIGGVLGSWSIGAFFMMPYLAPAQISSVEEKLTGQNHSAMYFAGNALVTSIVGAVSSGLVYENIKQLFITKNNSKIIWASNFTEASEIFNVSIDNVFNLGTILIPFVVSLVCIIGFFICFKMPRDFTPECIAKELKKMNPSLNIDDFLTESKETEVTSKKEIIFVQIALSILSGFIFGFIWLAYLLKDVKKILNKKVLGYYLLSCFIPFIGSFFMIKLNNELIKTHETKELKKYKIFYIIFGILFVITPFNIIGLSLMQKNINKIYSQDGIYNE